jgi:hypothetical protein
MRYVQNPAICAAELDGEVCLFNPATADYLNLNGSASAIWNLLAQPAGEDAIVRSLAELYAVSEEVCRRDTRAFLRRAVARGMLEERGD